MAVRTVSMFLLFIGLIVWSVSSQAQQEDHSRLNRVNSILIDKGFGDMAEMIVSMQPVLFPDLEILELKNKTYTIFAPGVPSFWARSNDDPTLSLVQYHIMPFKVDKDLLASPSMVEHKLDTLLQGHPLVVTTGIPEGWTPLPSLNLVPIVEWNVYNDGNLIVHGLPEFFNPEYQTSEYPWFDGSEAPAVSPATPKVSTGSTYNHRNLEVFSFSFFILTCLLFARF